MALRRRTKNIFRFVLAPLCIAGLLVGSYFYFPFQGPTPQAQAAWYNVSWSNRVKLTVNASKVGNTATTSQSFTAAGSFAVPAGVTSIMVKAWGAGGGGGAPALTTTPSGGFGGGGGYASSTITVTPGEVLTVDVGGGGGGSTGCGTGTGAGAAGSGTTGPGGAGGKSGSTGSSCGGGGGGGGTFLLRSATILLAAGGGGGGGGTESGGGPGGGGGGGQAGYAGNGCTSIGGVSGGSSSSSGAAGTQPGIDAEGPGGGGGGLNGGTGGTAPNCDSKGAAGGGGGTSKGDTIINGVAAVPGNNADSDRGTAGQGGASLTAGTAGKVVIYYAAPVSNFPVYVNLANLPALVWSTMRSDCGDIRITASDGSTELPREIVSCSSGSKTGEMWFQAPSLSSTANTVFYIYYGNSSATDYATNATYGAQKVWDSNYKNIWHLKDGTTLSTNDSTSNALNGTNTGSTAAAGQVDGGAAFNGSSNYMLSPSEGSQPSAFTMDLWFKTNSSSGVIMSWLQQATINTGYHASGIELVGGTLYVRSYNLSCTVVGTVSVGAWNHVVLLYNGQTLTGYLNGIQGNSTTGALSPPSPLYFDVGATDSSNCGSGAYFNGTLDEVRFSNTARSANWVQTEYNNQNSPSTFYTIGDPPPAYATRIFLTSATTWTVPADWNSLNNSIEAIGGGGGGAGTNSNNFINGGAGGAYAKTANVSLTPNASVTYAIGSGGAATSNGTAGGTGGDTYICNSTSNCASIAGTAVVVGAKGGMGGQSASAALGGAATSSIGSVKFFGGNGGFVSSNNNAGSGGGGGASSNGNGAAGGYGTDAGNGGTGGGGGGGGIAGSADIASIGGVGGNNASGSGGGASGGGAGSNGGGGGGGTYTTAVTGGAGGAGTEWDSSHGSGGGGGGAGTGGTGGGGGLYGGGGGGSRNGAGGGGAQGIIVISYTPGFVSSAPTPSTMSFLSPPSGVSSTSVSMTGVTAIDTGDDIEDQNGPVLQYLFSLSACGGANDGAGAATSSWQSSPSYTNTGLQTNKCYGYKVQARDGLNNYNATSTASTTYSSAATPGTPSLTSPTATTLTLANAENGNPASNPTTKFAAQIVAASPADPNWQGMYVDSSGNASSTKIWLSDAQLDGLVLNALAPATSYTLQVMARNEAGVETASSTATTTSTTFAAPSAPTYTNVSSASLTVNWSAVSGAASYKLERCSGATNCTPAQIAGGISATSYNDSGLTPNTLYIYRVRGSNAATDGPYSATSTQLTLPDQPGVPTYSAMTPTSVTISWSAPATGATTYKLERCQGDNCTNFSSVATGIAGTSYPDSGLTSGTNYRYRVRATNATGDGPYSGVTNTLLYNAPPGSVRFR